ncbi:MAG: membrane protein insertion efficiency factor YidD [Pseudomonadota bacterium]|nr:membrane protein insertion efficiency factor YidD [Pseudomonadota bacterium]
MIIVSRLLAGLIRLYQLAVSPYLPMSCRYQPTCSSYARQTLQHFGPVTGSWMALCRIARCHPWSRHGYDPVPQSVPIESRHDLRSHGEGTRA